MVFNHWIGWYSSHDLNTRQRSSSIQLFYLRKLARHQIEVILLAVLKIGMWVTAGGFLEWGLVLSLPKERGKKRKYRSWKTEVNIGALLVIKLNSGLIVCYANHGLNYVSEYWTTKSLLFRSWVFRSRLLLFLLKGLNSLKWISYNLIMIFFTILAPNGFYVSGLKTRARRATSKLNKIFSSHSVKQGMHLLVHQTII